SSAAPRRGWRSLSSDCKPERGGSFPFEPFPGFSFGSAGLAPRTTVLPPVSFGVGSTGGSATRRSSADESEERLASKARRKSPEENTTKDERVEYTTGPSVPRSRT